MPFSNTIETYYDQIIANIDQLNLAAGKGEVHVQHNERGNGASFKVNKSSSVFSIPSLPSSSLSLSLCSFFRKFTMYEHEKNNYF